MIDFRERKGMQLTAWMVQELLRRLDQKTAEYDQEKLDHAREKHFNREVQMREIQLGSQLRNMQAVMVSYHPVSKSKLRAGRIGTPSY